VAKKVSQQVRARERARRERIEQEVLRHAAETGRAPAIHPDDGLTENQRRRHAASTCGWCSGPIERKARGRIPKWCSPACRQRAWEQARAAASGRSAVTVVERRVEIPVRALPGFEDRQPRHGEWNRLLQQLAAQLDTGSIYARYLPTLTAALNDVLAAFERRQEIRAAAPRLR
jgi:hypothetical protein